MHFTICACDKRTLNSRALKFQGKRFGDKLELTIKFRKNRIQTVEERGLQGIGDRQRQQQKNCNRMIFFFFLLLNGITMLPFPAVGTRKSRKQYFIYLISILNTY
uniref:Uncharacterized protein n=1 Tax=Cacopsylla melanoneura TaxID=428564 RepID=A0A8D8SZC1_9HEMI